jgi:hypothetical protein
MIAVLHVMRSAGAVLSTLQRGATDLPRPRAHPTELGRASASVVQHCEPVLHSCEHTLLVPREVQGGVPKGAAVGDSAVRSVDIHRERESLIQS